MVGGLRGVIKKECPCSFFLPVGNHLKVFSYKPGVNIEDAYVLNSHLGAS